MGTYLSNSFPFNSQGLHLREVMVVSYHVSDNGLLIRMVHTDICNPEKIPISTLIMELQSTDYSNWTTHPHPQIPNSPPLYSQLAFV